MSGLQGVSLSKKNITAYLQFTEDCCYSSFYYSVTTPIKKSLMLAAIQISGTMKKQMERFL